MTSIPQETESSSVRVLRALRMLVPPVITSAGRRTYALSNMPSFELASIQAPMVGYGIALKRTGGEATSETCVRIYVQRKRSKRQLRSAGVFPAYAEFGEQRHRIAIDVVELPQLPQLHASFTAGAPISAGEAEGTLGAVVVDSTGAAYGLTCAHVVAPWFVENPFKTAVRIGLPGSKSALGTVEEWTTFSALDQNTADAALIRLDPSVSVANSLGPTPAFVDTPIADLSKLSGTIVRIRTRRGDVSAIVDSVKNFLSFGFAGRTFAFSNILAYQADVQPGDSGSSVVDDAGRVIGLHFAGNGGIGPGYCVTARKILQAFSNRQLRLL